MAFENTYNMVLTSLESSINGEEVDLDDLLKFVAVLFHEFQKELEAASPETKEDLINKMNELQKKLDEHGQVMSRRLGISQDEMTQIADKKENYSTTQIALMEKAKENIESAAEALHKAEEEKEEQVQADHRSRPSASAGKKKKRLKRSDWMKS
jgi:deoxyribodipyrimidine photolyase